MDCEGDTMNIDEMSPQLLTWLDVERKFKRATSNYTKFPDFITNISCYADSADIEYTGEKKSAIDWLRGVFDRHLRNNGEGVALQIADSTYEFTYLEGEKSDISSASYPLWRDQAYAENHNQKLPEPWASGPEMVAFHSFKGGVGRTTSLMTYAAGYLNRENQEATRILLIDADLEAPGISFWLANENKPTVSFLHLLEALHYSPTDVSQTLDYFAAELRKTSINVDGANREIFILPAALNITQIMDMQVQPEHLAKNPSNPWNLTDSINDLGKKLDADIVFIDLRAGLSELASPVLFDPRIEHFFVTTVAPQSVAGMAEILKRFHSFQSSLPEPEVRLAKPSVIISLLTAQLKQIDAYTEAVQKLNESHPAPDDDAVTPGIEWLEVEFQESLMSISSVRQALTLLSASSLYKSALRWANAKSAQIDICESSQKPTEVPVGAEAARLAETCERFQFAERAATDDMLVTDPIRNLAKHFATELPNVVSVGAKGAGKTFTYLQICRTQTWRNFLLKLDQKHATVRSGLIYPLLVSTNVEHESLNVVKAARKFCESNLDFTPPSGSESINTRITAALRTTDTDWEIFWIQLIISEFSKDFKTLDELNTWLQLKDESIVLVIDGIEDLFDSPEENEEQRNAIKALLQLPNHLNQIDDRRIGLVCFARADYVQAVIRQNLAQYLSRFQPFRLEWTPESFLRLAYWVCGKAEIIGADPDAAERQSTEQLIISLEHLWGKKMGGDGSKEANTARWVFAALCDLNGRLQARDLVRFLKISAKLTVRDRNVFWGDRVLAPEAIRKSLPECSSEKVKEAASEIKVLQQWQDSLEEISAEFKKVPFSATAVGLNNERLNILRELGIVYEDVDQLDESNRFYLPEIYRWGLGFQSSAGGRPRVQALLKRNLGRMPF
jgi:MinD-like ATPase involved in chromosome partitioning or flagellar assembly